MGGFRTELSGAASWENYDLERNTRFTQRALATAEPDGNSFYTALDVGIDLVQTEDWAVGPVVSARYIDGDIDANAESGAAMLNLSAAEQNNSGAVGEIGFEAQAALSAGDTAIVPHLRVTYETELDDMNHAVAVTSSVGQTRTVAGGTGTDNWVAVRAGLDIETGTQFSLSLSYQGTVDRGDGKDHAVLGRVSFAF